MEPSTQLVTLILRGDYLEATTLLEGLAAKTSYPRTILEVLEPALSEIGHRWQKEEVSLAAGYLAGKVAEDLMKQALAHDQALPLTKGPVVLGNIEDDHHSLGRKLLAIFLQSAGWKVIDLGNDVLAPAFVDKAQEVGAKIIGVSAMMLSTARNILSVRQEIDRRGLKGRLQLAVGGAVFKLRPELVGEVGGDGTVAQATDAPALFDRLWKEALR